MATGVHRSGTVYDHFEDNEPLCRIIDALPETSNDQVARETTQERMTCNTSCVYPAHSLTHVLFLIQTSSTNTRSSLIYWTLTWVSAAVSCINGGVVLRGHTREAVQYRKEQ